MVQLPAAFSTETPPAPGFTALLNWRPAFRAFIDRRICVVPLCVVVPHTAFTAAEFLPRDVARWRKALPTIQTDQFIRHDAIPPCAFLPSYHTGKGSRLFDAYQYLVEIKINFLDTHRGVDNFRFVHSSVSNPRLHCNP